MQLNKFEDQNLAISVNVFTYEDKNTTPVRIATHSVTTPLKFVTVETRAVIPLSD